VAGLIGDWLLLDPPQLQIVLSSDFSSRNLIQLRPAVSSEAAVFLRIP